jgi:hypothetical protein
MLATNSRFAKASFYVSKSGQVARKFKLLLMHYSSETLAAQSPKN